MCVSEPVEHDEPAGQAVHCSLLARPVMLLNVPSMQGSGALLPTSQYEPARQAKQVILPLSFMNLPASQLLHEDCLAAGCTVPGLHGASVQAPVEHDEPAGQSTQSEASALPEAPE